MGYKQQIKKKKKKFINQFKISKFFKKKIINQIFSIPWKNSRLPNLKKKKKNHQSNFFNSLKKFKTSKFFKKKNYQSNFFSIPWKISRLPNFSKKEKRKKRIFIKFFFRNRKLWSSSTFSSDATSSQLSTLSIHRSMEYVPN